MCEALSIGVCILTSKFDQISIPFLENGYNCYIVDDLKKTGSTIIEISENKDKKGIIMCGTGNGVSMVANKYEGVRAALCWNKETASLSRQHNNANVLSLPARFLTTEEAIEIVNTFLETDFEGGRHERRVNKINK